MSQRQTTEVRILQLVHERGDKLTQLGRVLLSQFGKLPRKFESALLATEPTKYQGSPTLGGRRAATSLLRKTFAQG